MYKKILAVDAGSQTHTIDFRVRRFMAGLLKATRSGLGAVEVLVDPYRTDKKDYSPSYKHLTLQPQINYVKEVIDLINDLNKGLHSVKDEQEFINTVANKVCVWMNFPKVALYLYDEENEKLILRAASSNPDRYPLYYVKFLDFIGRMLGLSTINLHPRKGPDGAIILSLASGELYFEPDNDAPSIPVNKRVETFLSIIGDPPEKKISKNAGLGIPFRKEGSTKSIGIACMSIEDQDTSSLEEKQPFLYAFGELAACILDKNTDSNTKTQEIAMALAKLLMTKLDNERNEVNKQKLLVETEKEQVKLRAGFNLGPSKFHANAGILFSDVVGYSQKLRNYDERDITTLVNIGFSIHEKIARAFGWGVDKIVGDEIMIVSNVQDDHLKSPALLTKQGISIAFNILKTMSSLDHIFKTKLIEQKHPGRSIHEMYLSGTTGGTLKIGIQSLVDGSQSFISIPWRDVLEYTYLLSKQNSHMYKVKIGLNVDNVWVDELRVETMSDHSFLGDPVSLANRMESAASLEPSALFLAPHLLKYLDDDFKRYFMASVPANKRGPYSGVAYKDLLTETEVKVKNEVYPVAILRFNNAYYNVLMKRYFMIMELLQNNKKLYDAYLFRLDQLRHEALDEKNKTFLNENSFDPGMLAALGEFERQNITEEALQRYRRTLLQEIRNIENEFNTNSYTQEWFENARLRLLANRII